MGKNYNIKFQGKRGMWGEGGWHNINLFHYLGLVLWECVVRIRLTWKGVTYLIGKHATDSWRDGFITIERKDDE